MQSHALYVSIKELAPLSKCPSVALGPTQWFNASMDFLYTEKPRRLLNSYPPLSKSADWL